MTVHLMIMLPDQPLKKDTVEIGLSQPRATDE